MTQYLSRKGTPWIFTLPFQSYKLKIIQTIITIFQILDNQYMILPNG